MFLQLKLTSQKHKTIRNIFIVVAGISVGLILSIAIWGSCSVKHLNILNDLESYDKTLDPEFCERIVDHIDAFNEECEPEIEIIDCG